MEYYIKVIKNYAVFTGRARRNEYWYFFLINLTISLGLGLLSEAASSIYSLAVLIPGICVGIRRMHDIGKSGWFILIPLYNLYLAAGEGDEGENEYGEDPKEIEE